MTTLQALILGAIQGIAEWLPVSSEGMIVLAQNNFFKDSSFIESVELALFLHLGTFLAALVYFRKDVFFLLKTLFKFKQSSDDFKKLFLFLLFSTLLSGGIGLVFLKALGNLEKELAKGSMYVNILIGIFLLGTGYLLLSAKKGGQRNVSDLFWHDWLVLGVAQGFSILPGFSRSGLTVSALLLRNFKEASALRISFLMSLPIVLGANIIMNPGKFTMSRELVIGIIVSFAFGYLTIDILLKFARKFNFGYFVIFFGFLMILAGFI